VDLLNETGHPATLLRTALTDDQFLAAVIAKVTYRVESDGRVVRDAENPIPVSNEPVKTPFGDLPPDVQPRKDGVPQRVTELRTNAAARDDEIPALVPAQQDRVRRRVALSHRSVL
jgi:hypothetical protein